MSRVAAIMAGAVLATGLVATGAHADPDYCSHYAGPTDPPKSQDAAFAYIVTGYRGAGSAGALDSEGCVQGKQAVDTRLVYPHADFALVILSAKCTQGAKFPGSISLNGLGLTAPNVPVVCGAPDAKGKTYYISDPYKIDPAVSGKITATVTQVVKKKVVFSYVAESHTVV